MPKLTPSLRPLITRRRNVGLPPGSVVFTGRQKMEDAVIHHMHYDAEKTSERMVNVAEFPFEHDTSGPGVNWYDVRGLHDIELIKKVGATFNVHNLALEDIADTKQRPKFDSYQAGNLIIIRALIYDKEAPALRVEQIGIYFGSNFIISFQEDEKDLFWKVRDRLNERRGKIIERGADYLAYVLMDLIVDTYYLITEAIEEQLEELEVEILKDPSKETKELIHDLKQEMLIFRRSVFPLKEVTLQFASSESKYVRKNTGLFLRDLRDHVNQINDQGDSLRDSLSSLHELHLSELSYRMNSVIQVLTIVSTIFIPLTFLAGIYGMNFRYMPELEYRNGYFVLLGVMAIIVIGMLYYFRRKRWL